MSSAGAARGQRGSRSGPAGTRRSGPGEPSGRGPQPPPSRPHLREPSDAEVAAGRPRCCGPALAAAGPSGSFCCCAALGTADRCPGSAPSRASPGTTNGNSGSFPGPAPSRASPGMTNGLRRERLSLTHVTWQAARGAPRAQTSPGNKAGAGASALGRVGGGERTGPGTGRDGSRREPDPHSRRAERGHSHAEPLFSAGGCLGDTSCSSGRCRRKPVAVVLKANPPLGSP